MRRWLFIATGMLLVATLAVGASLVAISYGWQRDWIREQLEVRVAAALDQPVAIGSVRGPLHRGVTLSEVRIGPADAPLISVDSLDVAIESVQLRGTPGLVLDRIRLGKSQIDLARLSKTQWPWDDSGTDDGESDSSEAEGRTAFWLGVGSVEFVDLTLALSGEGFEDIWIRLSGSARDIEIEPETSPPSQAVTAFAPRLQVGDFALHLALRDEVEASAEWLAGDAQGSFDRGAWVLDSVAIAGPALQFDARGRGLRNEIEDLVFSLDVPSIEALDSRLLKRPPRVNGALKAEAKLAGPIEWPRASVIVELRDLSADGTELGDASLKVRTLASGSLTFDALEWSDGTLDLAAAPGATITSDSSGISLGGFHFTSTRSEGSLSFEAMLPTAGVEHLADLQHDGETSVSFEAKAWRLATLQPLWTLLGIEAAGRVDAGFSASGKPEGLALQGEGRLSGLDIKTSDGTLRGGDFEVTFGGPVVAPRVLISGRAGHIEFDGTDLGALAAELEVEARALTIRRFDLHGGLAPIQVVSGSRIELPEAGGIRIEGLRLRSPETSGTLDLRANLPVLGEGSFEALQRDPRTSFSLRAEEWSLATLQPLWAALEIEVDGQLDASVTASGTTSGVEIEGGAGLDRLDLAISNGVLRGAAFEFSFDGTLAAPNVEILGDVEHVDVGGTALGALVIEAGLNGRALTLERFELSGGVAPLQLAAGSRLTLVEAGGLRFDAFVLSQGDQQIKLEGRVDEVGAEHLKLALSPLDLGRTLSLARELGRLPDGPNLTGSIAGNVEWHGRWALPEITADLRWTEAAVDRFEIGAVEASLATRGDSIDSTTSVNYLGEKALLLEARVSREAAFEDPTRLLRDERTSLVATLDDFDLRSLSGFLPKTVSEVQGFVTAQLSARGADPDVALRGDVDLRDGAVKLAGLGGQSFESIRGHLTLSGQNAQIENFGIGSPDAGIVGRGEYSFDGPEVGRLQSELQFSALPLDVPGLVKGIVSGPVRLHGELEALELDGRIEVAGLNVQIPDARDPIVREIRILSSDVESDPGASREKQSSSLVDNLRVDLKVVLSRNSWARGRGAEVELRGEVDATKERGGALGLSGTVDTVRGTYEIYGRRFRIERGGVTLDGAADPDPLLDVRAVHRVRGVQIYAIIEGRLSAPLLRFESVPDLDETDIASYLLFGRPMSGSAGEEQVALDAVAAQIATGVALREFERLVGGDLPVDLIDLRMDGSGSDSEIRAGVGKYVGDRLFLYYERGFGAVPTDELKAEYELTPNWSVESTVTAEGETAGDVVFEMDF